MNISKNKLSRFTSFKHAKINLLLIAIGPLFASILGIKIPIFIGAIARNFDHDEKFYASLWHLGTLFVLIYFNRMFFQLMINFYVKNLISYIRKICYESWIVGHDIYDDTDNLSSDSLPQGEILARVVSDAESFRELVTSGAFGALIDLAFIVSSLFSFMSINHIAGASLAGIEIFIVILLIFGGKYLKNIFFVVRTANGMTSRTVANLVGGIGESYYSEQYNYSYKKGKLVFTDFLNKQLKSNFWDASYYSLAESLYPVILASLVFILPYSNIVDAAIVFVIVDLIQRSIGPIKDITGKMVNIQRSIAGIKRIEDFLDYCRSKNLVVLESGDDSSDFIFESLEVKIEHFSYISRPEFMIKDIYLLAKKGELIGIVGFSGSGKSTLLKILTGRILGAEIALTLNASDQKTLSLSVQDKSQYLQFRRNIALISQDSHIFTDSLLFNITFGGETSSKFEEFWDWIQVEIPYIKQWKISPSDQISSDGLSAGQKQLVAALRSCYHKKNIVLLDEISSALDSELEIALRKVILVIQSQSLTIIVAHRLETIIKADKIIVMDDGTIENLGTHHDLLSKSVIYKRFVDELKY